jgi:hypothetical protein
MNPNDYDFTLNGEPLTFGPFTTGEGDDLIQHSSNALLLWTDQELAAIGVVRTEREPPEPNPVPERVSKLQAVKALRAAGLLANVEAAVAAAPADIQDYWAFASHFHRDHPELEAMRLGLGWTNQQLDNLFIAAGAVS